MPAFRVHHSKYRDAGKQAKTLKQKPGRIRLNKDVGSGGLFTGYPRLRPLPDYHWILIMLSKKLIDIGFGGGFHRILKIILDGF